MKIMNTEHLLETWKAGIDALIFPPGLVEDLKPDEHLDVLGDDLSGTREKFRDDVDVFISRIFELDTPQDLWTLLRKTDPTTVSLYYDRILAATYSLEQIKQEKPFADVPESWDTLSRMLLFQKPFQ